MAEQLIPTQDEDQDQQDQRLVRVGPPAKNQRQLIRVQPEQRPAPDVPAPSIQQATAGSPAAAAMPSIAAPTPARPVMAEKALPMRGVPQERQDAQAQGKLIPGTYHTDPTTGMQTITPYTAEQQMNPMAGVFAHAENIHNPYLRTLAKIGAGVGAAAYGVAESQRPDLVEQREKLIKMPGEMAETQARTEHERAQTQELKDKPDKTPTPEAQLAQSKLQDSARLGEIEQLMQQPDLPAAQKTSLGNEQKQIMARNPSLVPPARETAAQPAGAQAISSFHSQLPGITPHLSAGERAAYEFPAGYQPTAKEITEMGQKVHQAEQTALAGKREDRANVAAQAAADKRSMEENMIDKVAHDIAPMDVNSLSRLKDITSMRSDQRIQIFERAKELNSAFNTALVDRRVKMLDAFTNGKDGQNLQSFGTFLEHAGEASRVVQEIRNGATPKALNIAINKMEKEGYWTTATQITAALEPVRKEFEGFLLGGRALYGDDRKAAEIILNDASTPLQIQAALKQMGHTVSARYNEAGARFRSTVGASLEDVLGPATQEAHDGAAQIGLNKLGDYELKQGPSGYGWYKAGK